MASYPTAYTFYVSYSYKIYLQGSSPNNLEFIPRVKQYVPHSAFFNEDQRRIFSPASTENYPRHAPDDPTAYDSHSIDDIIEESKDRVTAQSKAGSIASSFKIEDPENRVGKSSDGISLSGVLEKN